MLRMWCMFVLAVLNSILISTIKSEEEVGAEYLKTVMNKLQSERAQSSIMWKIVSQDQNTDSIPDNEETVGKIMGPTPLPIAEVELEPSAAEQPKQNLPPPQPLSKEELAALYQAAINKGALLDLSGVSSGTVPGMQALQNLLTGLNTNKDPMQQEQGYYYYFYPIKSFVTEPPQTNEVKQQQQQQQQHQQQQQTSAASSNKPASQMAAMIPTAMMIIDSGSEKSVEPLFMAIAGFVGMALMFAFSVLFLPKFGNLRSRGISALKHAPDELAALTRLVLDGIDGKDCSERIACEIGRAVRKMQLDKKPLRVLEILLPPSLSKQLKLIRRSAAKKEKCNFIPCKWKGTKGS